MQLRDLAYASLFARPFGVEFVSQRFVKVVELLHAFPVDYNFLGIGAVRERIFRRPIWRLAINDLGGRWDDRTRGCLSI